MTHTFPLIVKASQNLSVIFFSQYSIAEEKIPSYKRSGFYLSPYEFSLEVLVKRFFLFLSLLLSSVFLYGLSDLKKKSKDPEKETRPPKSLLILSAPRTTSTLLLRFFSQPTDQGVLKKSKILLEPTTQVYHDKMQGRVPGYHPQKDWPHSNEEVMNLLQLAKTHFVVAKDLAYQTDWTTKELQWISKHYEVLFLVRHPEKTIPSNLYPYYEEGSLKEFNENDIGYESLGKLFKRFEEEAQIKPWVIEAEAYLERPEEVLSLYFKAFALEWKKSYLSLKPKTPEEKERDPAFKVWPDWYKNAYASSGVVKSKGPRKVNPLYKELLQREKTLIKKLLKKSLPAYHHIKSHGKNLSASTSKAS